MSYIGNPLKIGNLAHQLLNGGSSSYVLDHSVGSAASIGVYIDGVHQKPTTSYTVSGTTLSFPGGNTPSGTNNICVVFHSLSISLPTPGDGTVTNAKVDASAAIATSKISGAVTSIASHGLGTSATVDTGTSANQIVKLDGSAKIPAVDGSQLTNLPSDITKSTSEPAADTNPSGGVGTLWLRTTTGEMYCLTDATTDANVWTNIGDGTGVQPFTYMTATGGTVTTDGNYKVHSFTSSGTFQVTTVGDVGTVEYLVVAVGVGGSDDSSSSWGGGGGGAGGYLANTAYSVSAQSYTVTVGAGGAMDVDGSDSVFGSVTSDGGGRGGKNGGSTYGSWVGGNGGSGGGGSGGFNTTGGTATAGQGNDGGSGWANPGQAGGGGGGAGQAGQGEQNNHNTGGDGLQNDITGTNTYYAGGGGAGSSMGGSGDPENPGGQGGGGTGSSRNNGTDATAGGVNLGGGGGGGSYQTSSTSGSGGSGIVIIR